MIENITEKYIRQEVLPTPFCPGCGHGILMNIILRAIDELSLDWKKTVFVSGIGCAAWIPSPHFKADTLHTTHGRAVAFATGVKLFNPKLNVIVISGDGDLASIGGNHLIHAARRDINIPVICANNNIYGMTGGQCASTTPLGCKTATTPEGSSEPPFDLAKLVIGAGSGYVARATVMQPLVLKKYIKNALIRSCIEGRGHARPYKGMGGFSFIDALSPCFTQFGRRNKSSSRVDMMKNLKSDTVRAKTPEELFSTPAHLKDKIVVGEYIK